MEDQTPIQPTMKKSRKKGLILALLFVVLVAGSLAVYVVWFAGSTKDDTDTPPKKQPITLSETSQAAVAITSDGFSPETLSIAVGTKVTWTNETSDSHTVATNPHPAHSQLNEFGSTTLLQNETYGFVFDKAGTYTYHDEANPLETNGTIIVR